MCVYRPQDRAWPAINRLAAGEPAARSRGEARARQDPSAVAPPSTQQRTKPRPEKRELGPPRSEKQG
jgi:hypothetical protein